MSLKIFSDNVEQEALTQIYAIVKSPLAEGSQIRIMPDVHAGEGCVIGYTATLTEKICPNLIGVDLSCGVTSRKLNCGDIFLPSLDEFIKTRIPSGFKINKYNNNCVFEKEVKQVCSEIGMEADYALNSLGSLGGGNHFIELGFDFDNKEKYLTVHSGSRKFGLNIASHFTKLASQQNPFGKLSYLDTESAKRYIEFSKIASKYAQLNRKLILDIICNYLQVKDFVEIESVHNYIDFNKKIIRKGAISADKNETVIIPFNMRDGLIIGRGKGNPDWNYSAPHGAGRILSRSAAKKSISLEDFKLSMAEVYSSSVSQATIDESPFAYKPKEEILKHIGETVDIISFVKPILNFKAGG